MTIQDRIWANRIQNLPEIKEDHMVGKNVTIGQQVGTVTKEVGDDATGEVYEVEMEDGTTVTAGAHEMIITDPDADGSVEHSPDVQAEGTGDGSGSAESKEEDEEDTLDEYIKSDGTRRKVKGGDGRRSGESKNVEVEETYEDEEEPADYEEFFQAALKKFGVDSPDDFKSDEDKKKFFDYVDKNWKGEKKESVQFSAEELAHFESVLKKNELDEAQSVPLVRTGQGSYTKDTHPSDAERLYQAKDKKEYEKLMRDGEDAMRKGMLAKFGLVGNYKKFTVNIKFKDAKSRKKFEKMNKIQESVELDEAKVSKTYKVDADKQASIVGTLQRPEFKRKTRYNVPTKGSTVEIEFDNDRVRKEFEKMNNIK
tara:strand:- start:3620 stop:4723 length:1104 start_codon:yes stop_codon:yes gene_type:complete